MIRRRDATFTITATLAAVLASAAPGQVVPNTEPVSALTAPAAAPAASGAETAAPSNPAPVYGPQRPETQAQTQPVPASIPAHLAAAVESAASNYPGVRAGRAAARAARNDVRAAKQLRYPSVALEGVGFAGGSSLAAANNITANLVVDQPLWTGGRIGATIARARALAEVADERLDETMRDLELRVIEAYFQAAGAARRGAILAIGIEQHQSLVETIVRRVEQEVSPRADLDLAKSRTAQLEQQQALNQAQQTAAVQRLIQLTGEPDLQLGDVPDYDPALHHPTVAGLADQAVACDPRRGRFLAEARVATSEAKIARAQIFPQLSAQFSSNEITGQRAGLVLRAQSNGGLSQVAAFDSARLRGEAAGLQVGVAERELRESVLLDLVANISTRDRITAGETASGTAQSVTESYRRQFTAGRRTWLDVMNAVREAISADLSASDARTEAMATNARLLLRSCRWQPTISAKGFGQ